MYSRSGFAAVAGSVFLVAIFVLVTPSTGQDDGRVELASVAVAEAGPRPAPEAAIPEPAEPEPAAPAPQGIGMTDEEEVTPIAATTGTLGLFTLETGETLPQRGWSFVGYANKFTRMPGGVTILNFGEYFAYGATDWLNFYVGFEPYRHTHIGRPSDLSLLVPSDDEEFPLFEDTILRQLGPEMLPGYVEDFPFASRNDGGVGDVTLGLKLGLLSEQRGAPVSLSVRNDFIIPTRRSLEDLLDNGTQTGQFNDQISVALSKTWGRGFTFTTNFGYRFTRDPRSEGDVLLNQADQFRLGAGFIIFPDSRVQFMNEYTGVVFTGEHTPTETFGARDPVDGVWGLRLYPWRDVAIDLGYRYMLNLRNAPDRHGFVIKVGVTALPAPPPNRSPLVACSLDRNSVITGSGDVVNVTARATDPDGDPVTYTWTATGGNVQGTGAQVRWNPDNAAPGMYTVTVRVDDARGGTASCSVDARLDPRPNRPPTVSVMADRNTVLVGERVQLTATASDPDNDPLTYMWRTNGGQVTGTNTTAALDTTGVTPGLYTVTVRVEDGRGGAADASANITVNAPPPPPQATRIGECTFTPVNSARVDNECKRILDDVALRLQNEPGATVVIIGYADPQEQNPQQLAGNRAANSVDYLATERGVNRARMSTRTGTGQAGGGAGNRRIDIIWVPQGATF